MGREGRARIRSRAVSLQSLYRITTGLGPSSHQEMAASELLDTAVPAGNLPKDFPFVTANEFPFTLNPLEMDYELRVLTLAKERIMALPSLAGRNQLSGLCD